MSVKQFLLVALLLSSPAACAMDIEDTQDSSDEDKGDQPFASNQNIDQVLWGLRQVGEFKHLEYVAAQRWGKAVTFRQDNRQMSSSYRGVITINTGDVGMQLPTGSDDRPLPPSVTNLEGEAFWAAHDAFKAQWPQYIRLSYERLVVHELVHAAYGTENALVNDHHKLIPIVNRFMAQNYGEFPRNKWDDGLF